MAIPWTKMAHPPASPLPNSQAHRPPEPPKLTGNGLARVARGTRDPLCYPQAIMLPTLSSSKYTRTGVEDLRLEGNSGAALLGVDLVDQDKDAEHVQEIAAEAEEVVHGGRGGGRNYWWKAEN